MMPLSGAISLGFSTIVQPAASAGATLHMIWFIGQFHGVIRPHTPTGSRRMRVVPFALDERVVLEDAERLLEVREAGGRLRGPARATIGAPISCEIVSAISPKRVW